MSKDLESAMPSIAAVAEQLGRDGFAPSEIADALLAAAMLIGVQATSYERTACIFSGMAQWCADYAATCGEGRPKH
jgi:hypothetical protein